MYRIGNLLLLLLILYAIPAESQDIIVGVKAGIGNVKFQNQNTSAILKGNTVTRAGISLAFCPYFSKMFIVSGAEFESSKIGNFISVPLGIRLAFGEKVKPFFEFGGYYSFALNSKIDKYLLKNNAGARVGLGIEYALDKRTRLEIGYFQRFSLNPAIEEEIELPANQYAYDGYLMRGGNLEIGVKYRF